MKNLIKLEDIKKNLKNYKQHFIGVHPILLKNIVGTVGRYQKFSKYFIDGELEETARYKSVKQYYETNGAFPPIKVYQIKDKYFLIDGHHRVAYLIKETDSKYIDAEIIKINFEIDIENPNKEYTINDDTAKDFLLNLERESFEKNTGLFSSILKYPIILTELSGYNKLFNELRNYHTSKLVENQYYNGSEYYSYLLWYKDIFLPTIEMIKKEKILEKFKHRTEADLYVWINLHKYYLSQKAGVNIDFNLSKEDFVEKFGNKSNNLFKSIIHLITK